jgi:hypothetical protein
MDTELPRALLEIKYDQAAAEYMNARPPRFFRETTAQATQRKITLESLDLLNARRPDVQVFNELLVQYRYAGQRRLRQVLPNNMVVVSKEAINAEGCYDVPLQPVPPFWMLDYVSGTIRFREYEDRASKYERELKVPYYLLFRPGKRHLELYRHNGKAYRQVAANKHGRYPIPELALEIGLLDGWVRFWYQAELLHLPAEHQQELDEARQEMARLTQRAEAAEREVAQLRTKLERLRGQRGEGK